MKNFIKKTLRFISQVVEFAQLNLVELQLRKRKPVKTIKRHGYRFEVKPVSYILSSTGDNVVKGEFAGVYHKHSNTYIIALDKRFRKLKKRTKKFIIEHEIAHITHNLHNPNNAMDIETTVDLIAAKRLRLSKAAVRNCLRDTQRNAKLKASRKVLSKRIKNIK